MDLQFGGAAGGEADFAGLFENLVAGGQWNDAIRCANVRKRLRSAAAIGRGAMRFKMGRILAGGDGKRKRKHRASTGADKVSEGWPEARP